ncbi:hypothetical protein GYMLUDRAFT_48662 [Collybiopsis luxurians FD-317 M1]|uniref:Fungal-type protein kinase domain-containing protein n=1 Tax=Collybiopsis luxurians FD-317 M1 TaxID=944289 RepID=A0A0D0BIE7_9AGAR|nr:hypothetical protein GYMLUDRAFT_48662 [Collybiopsis luxurians FD-317 M1]
MEAENLQLEASVHNATLALEPLAIGALKEIELINIFIDIIRDHRTYFNACGEIHRDLRPENIMYSCQAGEIQGFLIDLDDAPMQDLVLCEFHSSRLYPIAHPFYSKGSLHSEGSEDMDLYRQDLRAFCSNLQWALRGKFYSHATGWDITNCMCLGRYPNHPGDGKGFFSGKLSPPLQVLNKSITKLWAFVDHLTRDYTKTQWSQDENLGSHISYGSIMNLMRSSGVQPDPSEFDLRLALKTLLPSMRDEELSPPVLILDSLSDLSFEDLIKAFIDIVKGHHSYYQQTGYVNGELTPYCTGYTRDKTTQELQGIFVDLDPLPLLSDSPENYLHNSDPISRAFAAYDLISLFEECPVTDQPPISWFYRHDLESLITIALWSDFVHTETPRYYYDDPVHSRLLRDIYYEKRNSIEHKKASCMQNLISPYLNGYRKLPDPLHAAYKIVADSQWLLKNQFCDDDSETMGGLFTYERVIKALESPNQAASK